MSTSCPVCDSTRQRTLYEPWVEIDDPVALYGAASGVRGTQRLVTCLECGMIYESPRASDAVILEGYARNDQAGHDSQHALRVKSFARALRSLAPRLPGHGARVLDVGTAGGAFLEAAGELGYRAVGLEPSQYLVEHGRARGLRLELGTIEAAPFEPGSFDIVCFWDVLEHVVAPRAALEAAHRLLVPRGTLLVNFPDIGSVLARVSGRWYWWILSVHLHHFSRATLRRLCERVGFDVLYFQRYWQSLELGYLEQMAIHFRVPFSRTLEAVTPRQLKQLDIPYYASQTTALARRRP